jgi:lipase chaperone LimK
MVGSVVVVGLIVFWLVAGREDSGAPTPSAAVAPSAPTASESAQAPGAAAPTDSIEALAQRPLPESLRGTDVDGGLTVTADGHFVPTADAIALFDYFLAASGEESADVIRARIIAHIRSRLDGDAALEAEALLETYLAFREELRELAGASEVPSDLERRLQWIRELRRKHFGAEVAETLFGESEDVARIDLERRRVAMDKSLEPEERLARLEALNAQLPESVRATRSEARAPQRVHEEVEALRRSGASDAEIFALREQRFGREAAERLAQYDTARETWEQRLEIYHGERDDFLGRGYVAELSPEEREAALEALRSEHFEGFELERVRRLDRFAP